MRQRDQTKLGLKRQRQRAAQRRYRQKIADKFRELGLSLAPARYGLPKKNKSYYFHSLHGKARHDAIMKYKRDAFVAQGLTTKGTPRKEQLHHLPRAVKWENISTAEDRKHYNANAMARAAIYRARNIAAGLTAKGKPRKDGLTPRTEIAHAWLEFRSTITIPKDRDWDDYGTSFAARENKIKEAA
jgi:hypothetical protein